MDTTQLIKEGENVIENNYKNVLMGKQCTGKNHIVMDYKDISIISPDLANFLLDEPSEALKIIELACHNVVDDLPTPFYPRVKNIFISDIKKNISQIRSKDIGKMLMIEGIVKMKSDVRPHITSTRFECPKCGNIINVLQLDEKKYKTPTKCGCGAMKGTKFRELSKERMDVYSLVIEEKTDAIDGGSKLCKIKALCRADLSNPEVERRIVQGGRIVLSGELREVQVYERGAPTPKCDWFLDVNYVEVLEESFLDLKYTKEDIEEFKAIAQMPDWLDMLRRSVFHDVVGFEMETKGVLLQMFAGVSLIREGLKKRGNFHVLLVGDAGTCKSTVLKLVHEFAPKSYYVSGPGLTAAGLTGSTIKDELLGVFTLEAGPLVLANNGVCCIDELDKAHKDHIGALHEPLEQETVSIAKGGITATMICQTAVLAAANPKAGSYSPFDNVYAQIDMTPTLINRFDLVFPIVETKLSSQDYRAIAKKMLSRGQKNEVIDRPYDKEFIKKYVSYARSIDPLLPAVVQDFLADKYMEVKEKRNQVAANGGMAIPITPRNIDGFRRVTEAIARSRFHKKATIEDAEMAFELIMYSLSQIGIDPDSGMEPTGELITDYEGKGRTRTLSKKDLRTILLKHIREHCSGSDKNMCDEQELVTIMEEYGFEVDAVEEMLIEMKKMNDIYEPSRGLLRLGGT